MPFKNFGNFFLHHPIRLPSTQNLEFKVPEVNCFNWQVLKSTNICRNSHSIFTGYLNYRVICELGDGLKPRRHDIVLVIPLPGII